MLRSCEKSISRKKNGSSIKKFPSLVLPGNTTMVTAPYYLISSLLSVSGCLRVVMAMEMQPDCMINIASLF